MHVLCIVHACAEQAHESSEEQQSCTSALYIVMHLLSEKREQYSQQMRMKEISNSTYSDNRHV